MEHSTNIIAEEIEEHPIEPDPLPPRPQFPTLPRFPRALEIVDEGNESIFESVIDTRKEFIESVMKESMLRMTGVKSPSLAEEEGEEDDLDSSNLARMNESLNESRGVSDVYVEENYSGRNELRRFENRNLLGVLR